MKIDLGQKLITLAGEPLTIGPSLDSRTLQVLVHGVINKLELETTQRKQVQELLDEAVGGALTLTDVLLTALQAVHDGEKLASSDRSKRMEYARKCNKKGMVKLTDSDVKYLMPLVEKSWPGPLVSVQVEDLLNGRVFKTVEDDESEEVKPPQELQA